MYFSLGLLISYFLYVVTEKDMVLGFLSRYDKQIWAKPLFSCPICSSFWYTTLVMICYLDFTWWMPLLSVVIAKIIQKYEII